MSAGFIIVTLVLLILLLVVTIALCCERIITESARANDAEDRCALEARDNIRLRNEIADLLPRGVIPIHDATVIHMWKRDLEQLDEAAETWGSA